MLILYLLNPPPCPSPQSCGVQDPVNFGFLDPPPSDHMAAALAKLRQQEALDTCVGGRGERLTPLGVVLASLPVDVHIGKMMVRA